MTRDDIFDALAAIEKLLDDRVAVVRVVIDAKGNEMRRIYRGSFRQPRDSQQSELPSEGDTP